MRFLSSLFSIKKEPQSALDTLNSRISFLENRIANVEMYMYSLTPFELENMKSLANLLQPFQISLEFDRLGRAGDGGYLVVNKADIKRVISIGVGDEVSADFELVFELGAEVFAFDPFVNIPESLANQSKYHFNQIGLAPSNSSDSSGRRYETLDSVIAISKFQTIDLLMVDIEGSEWLSLTKSSLIGNCKQIVIELHNLDSLSDAEFIDNAKQMLHSLLSNFTIVHIHANNAGKTLNTQLFVWPSIVEITLLSKKYYSNFIKKIPVSHKLPLSQDFPNLTNRPDIDISPIWTKN